MRMSEDLNLPKIKPCPFCKGKAEGVSKCLAGEYRVTCNSYDCDAAGPIKQTEIDAIEAWNRAAKDEDD